MPTSATERAMQFRVRVFSPHSAAVREETVQAPSKAAVHARFRDELLLSVRAVAPRIILRGSGGQPAVDVAWWCRELRTLLVAGMTVVEAIETMHVQSQRSKARRFHGELHGALL